MLLIFKAERENPIDSKSLPLSLYIPLFEIRILYQSPVERIELVAYVLLLFEVLFMRLMLLLIVKDSIFSILLYIP